MCTLLAVAGIYLLYRRLKGPTYAHIEQQSSRGLAAQGSDGEAEDEFGVEIVDFTGSKREGNGASAKGLVPSTTSNPMFIRS